VQMRPTVVGSMEHIALSYSFACPAEAKILSIQQQQDTVPHDQSQDNSLLPSQAPNQPDDSLEQILDIMEPFYEASHGPLQTPALSQPNTSLQTPAPSQPNTSLQGQQSAKQNNLGPARLSQKSDPVSGSGPKESGVMLGSGHESAQSRVDHVGFQAATQQSATRAQTSTVSGMQSDRQQSQDMHHNFSSAAAPVLSGDDRCNTAEQQACATDDGDFEQMMARFDELERQEAAQDSTVSAGMPSLKPDLCAQALSLQLIMLVSVPVSLP